MAEVLYAGAFDVRAGVQKVTLGAAPSNHLHAMTQLRGHGLALRTLPTDAQVLRGGWALQRRILQALRGPSPPAAVVAHSHYGLRSLALMRRLTGGRLAGLRLPLAAFVHSLAPRPWDRAWLQGLDLLMPLTRLAQQQLQAMRLSVPVVPVPYGADLDFYPAHEPASHAQATPRDLVLSVGVCGRDYATLIQAAAAIAQPVHIVGRLPQAQREAAQRHRVHLHSSGCYDLPFAELLALYRRAACVVVATHGSAHPYGVNALVEAMALGCPVVATAGPGLDLDPAAEGFGLRVPAHDADALAAAVNRILADPAGAQAMGLRARAVAQTRANARGMAQAIALALWRVLPRSGQAA